MSGKLRIPGCDWTVSFQLYEKTANFRDSWAASFYNRDMAIERMRQNWQKLRLQSYCQVILTEPKPPDAPARWYGLHFVAIANRRTMKLTEHRQGGASHG